MGAETLTRRPNILLVMCDQLRADALQPESTYVRTPHVAALAAEGFWLSELYTNSPECVPARASLAEGRYPFQTGIMANRGYTLDLDRPNWMQAVHEAGYATALFGKTHLQRLGNDLRTCVAWNNRLGFETVDETRGPREMVKVVCNLTLRWQELGLLEAYRADFADRFATNPYLVRPSPLGLAEYYDVYVPQQARTWLEAYEDPRPFFCWVSFGGPHEPYDTPEPYNEMYEVGEIPAPVAPAIDMGEAPASILSTVLGDRNDQHPGLPADDILAVRRDYAGAVSLIDDQIGELVRTLKDRGLYEDTIIIVTSDHGEMNGDHGLLRKGVFLNASVRVPMVVRLPEHLRRTAPAGRCDALAELMDLGPTIAEAAGASMTFPTEGRSLLGLVRGHALAHRPCVMSEYRDERMILTRRWKMVLNGHGEVAVLIDRRADPDEHVNLAGSRSVPLSLQPFVPGMLLHRLGRLLGLVHPTLERDAGS